MKNSNPDQLSIDEKEGMRLKTDLNSAIDALERCDFVAYIKFLDSIGSILVKLYKNTEDKSIESNSADGLHAWLQAYLTKHNKINLTMQNALAFCVFEEAWRDDYFEKSITASDEDFYQRHLTLKANLNRSSRHRINLGMRALAFCSKGYVMREQETPELKAKLDQYNAKASHAIRSYKTTKQKALTIVGYILAGLMALVCAVTTAAAIVIATAGWPVTLSLVLAGLIFAATGFQNWRIFKNAIPNVLIDILGKDKYFEGWTHFNDEKTGQKTQLSKAKKIALAGCTVLAISVGGVGGALTYSFIISLGKIALFSFITASTIGAACLPPVAIVFAAIFCIAISILMIKAFAGLLRSNSVKEFIKRPFADVAYVFDPNNERNLGKSNLRLKVEKGITYTIVGLLSVVGLFGLTAMQLSGGASLGAFLHGVVNVAPAVANKVAYSISLSIALVGQIPFVLESVTKTVAKIATTLRNVFSPNKPTVVNDNELSNSETKIAKIVRTVINGVKTCLTYGTYLVSALGNGALVLHAFSNRYLSDAAAAAGVSNSMSAAASSHAPHSAEDIQAKASTQRITNLLNRMKRSAKASKKSNSMPFAETQSTVSSLTPKPPNYLKYFNLPYKPPAKVVANDQPASNQETISANKRRRSATI